MVSAIISLLAAIFRAIPSVKGIVERAIELSARAREADALRRKQEKDEMVHNAVKGDDKDKDEIADFVARVGGENDKD